MKLFKRILVLMIVVVIFCAFGVSAYALTDEYVCARADLHQYPYGLTSQGQSFKMNYHTEVLIREVGTGNKVGQLDAGDTVSIVYPNDVFYNGIYWSSVSANGVQGISASYFLH